MPIIPPRKRAQIRKGAAFAPRNAAIAASRRCGRDIWKDWSGYHRRSLLVTKMDALKKLGEQSKQESLQGPLWSSMGERLS